MFRSLLNITLILVTFFFVYFENFYLQVWPPQVGQTSWVTLRSVTAFTVEPLDSETPDQQAIDPGARLLEPEFSTPAPLPRADAALNRNQSDTRAYAPGDILVPFRKQIDTEDQRILNAYQRQVAVNLPGEAPWVAFIIVFMVLFYHFFLTGIVEGGFQKSVPAAFLLSLFILYLVLLKAILLTAPLPSIVIPFALLPLLIIIMNQGRITAVGTTVVAAVLVGLFAGNIYPMTLLLLIGGLTAVMAAGGIQKRSQIIWPSLAIGIVNVIAYVTMSGNWPATVAMAQRVSPIHLDALRSLLSEPVLGQIGLAFLGGFSVGPLALILLPLLELSTHNASRFRLNRYTDLQQPMIKKLFSDAPGTYQHSMTVSYLAQSAGEAIGANSLLLRIGAYYHDIGKMEHPRNFIENQFNGENPHDDLEPDESVDLIIDHVKRGVRYGFDARLPKVVVDLIQQHHGTQVIEYFYNSATNTNPKKPVREKDFRYPGPKPQTIEAAILMISDAVEAASRSLRSPNRRNFEKMVRMIILKRIADGQFSECGLDTRDIDIIIRTLVDCLEASFHSRVQYPWQKKPGQRKGKGKGWITGFDDKEIEQQSFRL